LAINQQAANAKGGLQGGFKGGLEYTGVTAVIVVVIINELRRIG